MKKAIETERRIVLYEVRNDQAQSRKKCLGYELAILTEKGKVEKSWAYEASELFWAREGCRTLIDAQARGVLSNRTRWKPYSAHRRIPRGSKIESLGSSDDFAVRQSDSLLAQEVA
jgi:hypothetical protein